MKTNHSIKPNEKEKEIISEIQRDHNQYSVDMRTGEIYRNDEFVGQIRRKFIPFGSQYRHHISRIIRETKESIESINSLVSFRDMYQGRFA